MPEKRRFVVRDAVHGDIHLTGDEGRILDTREMQRLRGVQQLGLAHLVFPGARHSRFEHSIGTLHTSERLAESIRRNAVLDPKACRGIDDEELRVLRAAALVHDVTHLPFGHNIEDQSGLLERHDEPARYRRALGDTEVGRELERQGLRSPVLGVLGAGAARPFLGQMLSDTICSDLMDYLRRDAYYTGLNHYYDERIADYFKIDPASERLFVDCVKDGLLREDIVSEVLRMLQARYYFSERVYYHHAKIAAGAMVARAVETAIETGCLGVDELETQTDEGLLLALAQRLGAAGGTDAERALRLVDELGRRRLVKRVSVFPYACNVDVQEGLIESFFTAAARGARREFEREREAELSARFSRDEIVLLYCPKRGMQLKEVDTLVRMPGEEALAPLSTFRGDLPRIADLEESYLRLWKAYVLTTACEPELRSFVQERVRAALPGATDAYRIRRGPAGRQDQAR